MQLIIIYDSSLILNNLYENDSIDHIKNLIGEKINMNNDQYFLQYGGKNLENDKTLHDYNLHNNSIIFLHPNLKGGTIQGFPDIGHLIILLAVVTIVMSGIYFFFYNMKDSLLSKKDPMECDPKCIKAGLLEGKGPSTLSGGQWDNKSGFAKHFYNFSTIFYVSIFTLIMTIYLYIYFCSGEKIPFYIIILAILSLLLLFIVFVIIYKLKDKLTNLAIPKYTLTIMGILFSIFSIVLFTLLVFSGISQWVLLFPLTTLLAFFIIYNIYDKPWSKFLILLMVVASIFLLVYLPYTIGYVYSVYKNCK